MLIDSSYCFKTQAFPHRKAQTIEPLQIRLRYGEICTVPKLAGQKGGGRVLGGGSLLSDVPRRSSFDGGQSCVAQSPGGGQGRRMANLGTKRDAAEAHSLPCCRHPDDAQPRTASCLAICKPSRSRGNILLTRKTLI